MFHVFMFVLVGMWWIFYYFKVQQLYTTQNELYVMSSNYTWYWINLRPDPHASKWRLFTYSTPPHCLAECNLDILKQVLMALHIQIPRGAKIVFAGKLFLSYLTGVFWLEKFNLITVISLILWFFRSEGRGPFVQGYSNCAHAQCKIDLTNTYQETRNKWQ